jgi:cobyrinic acid a,c-diamide synthase
MSDLVARHVDLAALVGLARAHGTAEPWSPAAVEPVGGGVVVALAAGKAFSFGYPEHAELLRATGAEVVEFDPMTESLPEDTSALVLPGGFPEQFTAELSANDVVRQQIRALAESGAPIHAECAGLTYLVDDLDGVPMCGVLSGSAHFTERLVLGYRDAVAPTASSVHAEAARVTGHEFHRTAVTFDKEYPPAWVFGSGGANVVTDGAVSHGVHGAYLHTHAAAHPEAVTRFVSAASRESGPAASRESGQDAATLRLAR